MQLKFFLDNDKLIRGLSYGGLAFFFLLLQLTLVPRYPIYGVSPDLMLSCVLAVSMFEGGKFGAVMGVTTGFVIDAVGSVGLSLLPLVYMLFGYITGICSEFLFRRGLLFFTIASSIGYFLRGFVTLINISASWNHYSTSYVFLRVIFPEIGLSVLFSYFVYIFFRLLAGKFHSSFELKN
ncbi:MAG: hypothetical protein IKT70_04165 [Clostridia bacterium]|nr:hypothetical protein [Clostridia bacterium]